MFSFVDECLAPQWERAVTAAIQERANALPRSFFSPTAMAVHAYIGRRGAELVTNLAAEQRRAIRAVISGATHINTMTADSLSKLIRPLVGLTKPQALANMRYYNTVLEATIKANPHMTIAAAEKKARATALKYAVKQHWYRAMNIARTELAAAYNQGGYDAIRAAQAQGYMGDCKKVWLSADDERVCPHCGGIEGETVRLEARFSNGVLLPPAHPQCRCAVAYEEVSEAAVPQTVPYTDESEHLPLPENNDTITLSDDERHALNGYVSSASYQINDKLRNGTPLTANDEAFISRLDAALSKLPAYRGIVYRSITDDAVEDAAAFIADHAPGDHNLFPGYTSSATGFAYDDSFPIQYIIESKTGVDLRQYNSPEREVLFRRNTRFIVRKVEGNVIYMEEL